MRKRLLLTTLGVGLVAAAGAVTASAMATQEIKAHIPFSFEVENTVLPAGNYTITPQGIDDPSVLVIRNDETERTVQFLTNATTPGRTLQSAELVFDRVGNKEFLRDVLVPGDQSAELAVSPAERQAETVAMKAAERHSVAAEHHALTHEQTNNNSTHKHTSKQ
jgi:hypothetical protein